MPRPRALLIVIFAFTLYSTTAISGEDEIYTSVLSNSGAGGYDVVAYFTDSMPIKGGKAFTTKYTPQYGGYCAYAVANNYTASGDPLQWTVHNDKLYLNYSANVLARWTANRDNFITQGDTNWPGVLD